MADRDNEPSKPVAQGRDAGSGQPLRPNRRQFLEIGAAALVSPSIQVPAIAGPLRWSRRAAGIALLDQAREIWFCAFDALGPDARVVEGQTGSSLWLRVTNGATAGKEPIALQLQIADGSWTVTLDASYLDRPVNASLRDWLNRSAALEGRARREERLGLLDVGQVTLRRRRIETTPDFRLIWSGPEAVTVRLTGGVDITGDRAVFEPRSSVTSGSRPLCRFIIGTGVIRQRSSRGLEIGDWSLRFRDGVTRAEVARDPQDDRSFAVYFETAPGRTDEVEVHPSERTSVMPRLVFSDYAVGIVRGADDERVLTVRQEPARWFSGPRAAISLQSSSRAAVVESLNGVLVSRSPGLRLDALRLPLAGADWSELRVDGSTPEELDYRRYLQPKGIAFPAVALDGLRLKARRTADVVDVAFSFQNLQLRCRGTERVFDRRDSTAGALLRVHLHPQATGEETYFVQESDGTEPSATPTSRPRPLSFEPKKNPRFWARDPVLKAEFEACMAIGAGLERDVCLARLVEKAVDEEANAADENEFNERSAERVRPFVYAAESSRLVFEWPEDPHQAPHWSLDGLLDWDGLRMVVAPRAAPIGTTWSYQALIAALPLEPPGPNETSIEAPFRFQMSLLADPACIPSTASPNSQLSSARWVSSGTPPSTGGIPLWHARSTGDSVRALWARGFEPKSFSDRYGHTATSELHPNHARDGTFCGVNRLLSFDSRDRHEVVALSSVFGLSAVPRTPGVIDGPDASSPSFFAPESISTQLLTVSTVGSSLKMRGRWEPPLPAEGRTWPALTVEDWLSHHSWGREVLGRVVYRGFLYPLAVKVSLVKVTERRLVRDPLDERIKAVLLQRLFIVLPKKPKLFPTVRHPFNGRDCDAVKVEFITEQTPDLFDPNLDNGLRPANCSINANSYDRDVACWSQDLFWPQLSPGRDVIFKFRVTDQANKVTVRTAPFIFVSNFLAYRRDVIAKLGTYYDTEVPPERKAVICGGQRVGYAPLAPQADARPQTIFETDRIVLGAHPVERTTEASWDQITADLVSGAQPAFYPFVRHAVVNIPAIDRVADTGTPQTRITYDAVYQDAGFAKDRNEAQIFARVAGTGVALDLAANSTNTGGVATPTTRIVAISRSLGLIGGTANVTMETLTGVERAAALTPSSVSDSVALMQQGRCDSAAMFSTSAGEAKLFGDIRLADVVAFAASHLGSVPKFIDELVFNASQELKVVFCSEEAGALGDALTRLEAAVGSLPDSPGKRRLAARIQSIAGIRNRLCASWDTSAPPKVASDIAMFVAEAQHFVDEVRVIVDGPAALVPDDVQALFDGLKTALEPYLPPFDPADQLRAEIRAFVEAVLGQAIDEARTDVLAQIEPLRDYFRPALLNVWQNLTAIRDRYAKQANAIEAEVVARLDEASVYVGQQIDQLAMLAEAAQAKLCAEALELIAAARDHFLPSHGVFDGRLRTILETADGAIRQIAAIARNPTAPKEVRDLATSLHSQLRPSCDKLAAALSQLLQPVSIDDLSGLCNTDWKSNAPTTKALLASAKAMIHTMLARADVVTLMRPLVDAVERATQVIEGGGLPLARTAATATTQPGRTAGDIAGAIEALKRQIDDLIPLAAEILLCAPDGANQAALTTRIEKIRLFVERVKATNLSERLNAIVGQIFTRIDATGKELVGGIRNPSHLEQLARLEEELWQAVVDSAIPGSLPGFEHIGRWQKAWQDAANRLRVPAVRAVTNLVAAIPDYSDPANAPAFIAEPLRKNLVALRASCVSAAEALGEMQAVQGRALLAVSHVVTQAQRVGQDIAEHLSRADVTYFVSLDGIVRELEAHLLSIVPTRRAFKYDWATSLQQFPPGAPIFVPLGGDGDDLEIHSRLEVSIGATGAVSTTSQLSGVVRNFKIALFPGLPLLSIYFDRVSFASRDGGAPQYDVRIRDFELAGSFQLVAALGKLLGGSDDGPYLRLVPNPPSIEAGFAFGTDIVQFGAFTVQNIRLALAFRLPLDNRSATFVFSFASRNKPFLISALPCYGGGGFLALTATPSKLVAVEGALEFGAITAIKFGVLDASGRVVAGFAFRFDESTSALSGYVLATGCGRIAWFGISVTLRVEVKSEGGNASGAATFEVSFDISSIVKVTFQFTASYGFAGSAARTRLSSPAELRRSELGATRGTWDTAQGDICKIDPQTIRDRWKRTRRHYEPVRAGA